MGEINGKKYEMKFSWYDYIKYFPLALSNALREKGWLR